MSSKNEDFANKESLKQEIRFSKHRGFGRIHFSLLPFIASQVSRVVEGRQTSVCKVLT